MALYRTFAMVTFWGGLLFTALEVVYGYFFNVWSQLGLAVGGQKDAWLQMTKVGETMLFGFLALACFLASIAASRLARPPST